MERDEPEAAPPGAIAYGAVALLIPCTVAAYYALYVGWSNLW